MIFIITILLLAMDFYYLKNIAGRRLVGLRWWNEVDPSSGDSHWVFESSEPGTKTVNPTDSRFFWLAIYSQPVLWVALAILAIVRLKFMWLPLVGKIFLLSFFAPHALFSLSLLVVYSVSRRITNGIRANYSYRSHSHHHQYPRLLPLRQVQPGVQSRRQRPLLEQPGWQPRKQHGRPHVYVWSRVERPIPCGFA